MTTDERLTSRAVLLLLLTGPGLLAGTALTWGAAFVGLARLTPCTLHRPVSTAKLRVKAAQEAVTQFMIETPTCPSGLEELVAEKLIDLVNSKDPWGSELTLKCPGTYDSDGADVSSPGPDRQLGTADDIKSWEL